VLTVAVLLVVVAGCDARTASNAPDVSLGRDGSVNASRGPNPNSARCDASTPAAAVARVRVSAEVSTACAWRSDGPVWCWGTPMGIGSDERLAERRPSPTRMDGLYAVAQVDVGDGGAESFACALESDGSVRCWGDNRASQLGNDASKHSALPQLVAGLSDIVEIASAADHSCARSGTGEVRCWGMGRSCELGQGSCWSSIAPVAVVGLTDASQLVAGLTFTCALKRDATVACWGGNGHGEVGNGSGVAAEIPAAVQGLRDVVRISATQFSPCAQTRDGRVFCWGSNEFGDLGVGSRTRSVPTPIPVHNVPCNSVLMPSAPCVVTAEGEAWCWGTLTGDGRMTFHEEGAAKVPLAQVVAVSGHRSLLAVTADERIWAWGFNDAAQLGDGSTESRWTPVEVSLP
jgi:alpha-tubulin suppressor-like RCC1 family protein